MPTEKGEGARDKHKRAGLRVDTNGRPDGLIGGWWDGCLLSIGWICGSGMGGLVDLQKLITFLGRFDTYKGGA